MIYLNARLPALPDTIEPDNELLYKMLVIFNIYIMEREDMYVKVKLIT